MKILAFGDSIKLPTGYGRVSQNVLGYFALKGHEVHQIGWNHHEPPELYGISDGNGHTANITLIPPFSNDQFHTESVLQYAKAFQPDLIYNSNDYFTSQSFVERKEKFRLANYGVIDGPGCGEAYRTIIERIDIPITPSKYGFRQLKEINRNGLYIPHGVNTNYYKPLDNKEEIKKKFGLSGKFVFGCANRNIWRKQYPNILNAFAKLKDSGIKDIALFLICDPLDMAGNNIFNWAHALNLTVSNDSTKPADIMMHPRSINILFPLNDIELAESFNAWDVMISASMSEGFGLVTIESQACGVPSIICDNTANTELVEGHGWLYPIARSKDGGAILVPPTIKDITYWYEQPDYGAMREAMLDAYLHQDRVLEFGRKSLEFAKLYSWDNVLPKWDVILK